MLAGVLQNAGGLLEIIADTVERLLDNELYADRGGQMENGLGAGNELFKLRAFRYPRADKGKGGVGEDCRQILFTTGREIIDNGHAVAAPQEMLSQM